MNEQHERIRVWMGWCLIITALTIDLVEMLMDWVVIGWLFSPVLSVGATFLFWLWFQLLGVSYTANTKRFAITTIQAIGELVPGLDTLPVLSFLWTIGMIFTVVMVRMEDRGKEPSVSGAMSEIQGISDTIAGNRVGNLAIRAKRRLTARNENLKNTLDLRQPTQAEA